MRVALRAIVAAVLTCASCARAQDAVPNVYFGNLHSHTSYSDGSGTPEQAYTHARDVAKLDFLAITEHNHAAAEDGATADRHDGILIGKDHNLYVGPQATALIPTAGRFNQDGTFIAFYGQEFSSISKGNHMNVFEVPEVIDAPNGRFDQLLQWCAQHSDSGGEFAVLQLNHPGENAQKDPFNDLEYGADDFGTKAQWVKQMGAHACLIELLNGPAMAQTPGHRSAEVMEDDYQRYLLLGFRVAPTGDQDNHYMTWGDATESRTGIIAAALSKTELLKAMRARHVYATEDRNLKLVFKVNGHLCGDAVDAPAEGSELAIAFHIEDADEPTASYKIDLIRGTVGGTKVSVVNSLSVDGNTAAGQWQAMDDVNYSAVGANAGGVFYYFRVTQTGEENVDRAWTAPLWFAAGGGGPPTTNPSLPPGVDVSKCVASKNSSVYHVSAECQSAKMIKPSNLLTGEAAVQGRIRHEACPQE